MIALTIDGTPIVVPEGTTILEAAQQANIYIPRLCSHPDLPPSKGLKPGKIIFRGGKGIENQGAAQEYEGCQLCVVKLERQRDWHQSCSTPVAEGMIVYTDIPEVQEFRRDKLMSLLEKHPHICLTCAQKEGCAREPCSLNIPMDERCCPLFGRCEFQKVAEYIGIKLETPRYVFENLPVVENQPLFKQDYNLCIGCTRCVRVCRDVRGVGALDFVFDETGRVIVGTVAPDLEESSCRFCTACVEVCPTGSLTDKELLEEAPCRVACPAGIDVPRYVHLIGEGKYAEAAAVIREKVPFPAILGYICPRPCEIKCRRREINDPISIRDLKRCAAEHDDGRWKAKRKIAPPTGKRVAIIGSGPAGLTSAYYLAKLGHSVTIFESKAKPGGMMRTGIPRFLLPEKVLDKEINEILSLGIELKLNSPIQDAAKLLQDGYDAVLIAIGLQAGRKLPIPGADLSQVLIGLDFLEAISKGEEVKLGEKVLVLGGGSVACDVARTVRRLGIYRVSLACLESRETMPALPWDIKEAAEEEVKIFPSRSFRQILDRERQVCGVECLEVKWMKFDEEGRLHLETTPDSEHVVEADTVIFATGQGLERTMIDRSGIELSRRGVIKTAPETLETNLRGIFACGDAVSGSASVIEGIAMGRKAASAIDRYLGGEGVTEESLMEKEKVSPYLGREEKFGEKRRIEAPLLPVEERVKTFDQVSFSLTEEQALAEARRCLRCDLRFQLSKVILPPKKKLWLDFTPENVGIVPETGGVYQLLDEQENIIYIKGTINLQKELEEQLATYAKARYFVYEEHPMYSKRESELLQQFLAEHGEMPEGNRELEELF